MATRTYAQVNASLLRSRKFRGLCHKARWTWLCALLKADYAGFAEYPVALWALDAELEPSELSDAIATLVEVDLISWCPDLEVARVSGFIRQRPPNNASAAQRLCMDLTDRLYDADGSLEAMLFSASAEFAVAAVGSSLRWDKDRPKFRDGMGQFLRGTAQDFGDEFYAALDFELKGSGRPVRTELEGLLPPLSLYRQNTVPTPCPHRVDTRNEDETRRRQDPNKDEDKDLNDANFEISRQPQTEQPAASVGSAEKVGEILDAGSQHGPTDSLKRSALVVEMRGCA